MVATPQIGRKLARKRAHKHVPPTLFQGGVIGDVIEAVRPGGHHTHVGGQGNTPLSLAEFEAELDAMAEGSENRPAPLPDVFSREHLYADHD
jgi:hypothetical protein